MENKKLTTLPVISAFETDVYKPLDKVEQNRMEITKEAVLYLKNKYKLEVVNILWEGKFIVSLETQNNQKFIFGSRRNIKDQIYDLDVIINESDKSKQSFREIDLSSNKVSVK